MAARWGALLVGILLAALLPGPVASGGPSFPAPANPVFLDVDPWFLGDSWNHTTHSVTRSPDGTYTDTTLVVETRVTGVRTETVGGRVYTLYNATTTGSVTTQGRIPVPSVGVQPYALTGASSGWVWTDRSDLATVRTNQTGSANGTVTLPFPLPPATITASLAETVTFDPAAEDHDFPLEAGDAWSYNVTQTTTGFARYRIQSPLGTIQNTTDLSGTSASSIAFWFNVTEDVVVPAGTFVAAARMEAEGTAGAGGVRWYHPAAKNLVKSESHIVAAPDNYTHVWVNLTSMNLMPPPWPGSITLAPQRISPGGWLNASGLARPDEDLRIRIPASGASYATRSDAVGAWSVRIRAPAPDDFTPANADAGSHGVLVEPSTAPPGWEVATVQLVLPDLHTDPSDLVLSPPVPAAGVPVAVNGTVRAAAAVNVSSAFNVSFTADGVEFGRVALPGLAAGDARTVSATWTPTPGWHTVEFAVDPDDEVREADEGNNTAARAVFVAGADLVPVNLTIEGESTVTVADPGAVGFASTVQGRLGGFVNITFQVLNEGGADAGPSAVLVTRTQGLRGPPLGPPVLRANASALAAGERAGPWTASWPVPARAGVYHLNVTADADGQVNESFESNNTFVVVVNVSGPDYRIVRMSVPAKSTTSVSVPIVVTIRNDGQLAGDRSAILAGYEGSDVNPYGVFVFTPLTVGEERDEPLPWNSQPSGGVRTLRFVVDAGDDVEEMDEGNNNASATIEVRDRPITQISWTGRNVSAQALFVTDATEFTLTAEDRSGEGLTTWYRAGAAAIEYVGPFRLPGDGPRVLAYWSIDRLGGVEAEQFLPVFVDTTPPVVRASVGERDGNRTVVTLNATDDGVGIEVVEVRVDNGTWQRYSGPFPVEGHGDHVVAFRAVDRLGNARPEEILTWTIRRPVPASLNLKPLLAVVFAAALLGLGYLRRRQGARGGLVSSTTFSLGFAAAELATGAASLAVPALAVPPYGLGLAVDLAILAVGAFLTLSFGRPPREPTGDDAVDSSKDEPDPHGDGAE